MEPLYVPHISQTPWIAAITVWISLPIHRTRPVPVTNCPSSLIVSCFKLPIITLLSNNLLGGNKNSDFIKEFDNQKDYPCRPRGRPRKLELVPTNCDEFGNPLPPKSRGRPRKYPLPDIPQIKKPVGRPRIHQKIEDIDKKPVGRPRIHNKPEVMKSGLRKKGRPSKLFTYALQFCNVVWMIMTLH